MAGINRVGSPMDLCEESLEETKEVIDKKKKELSLKQRTRSPFLIGSIEEVNKKISRLDKKLQQYTELIVESRASDYADLDDAFRPPSAKGRERVKKKEREIREMNKFAGYYTLKQTFLPGRSERVKNISKISIQPSKTSVVHFEIEKPSNRFKAKKDTGKPKFVELYQYPGYDPTELTPLPDDVPAKDMLEKAAEAQVQLRKKPHYRPDFENWFYSQMSQAVFLDIYWYLFLEKYQTSKNSQVKLFNRAAFNYVKLMWYVRNPVYRDIFFKEYPSLIAQAVYAGYCYCFPDSYRQFGEDFKEDVCELVYGWIAGIRPAPRCWLKWNVDKLEPPNIKMREEILSQKDKKSTSTVINFDYLDSLISSNVSRYASTTSLSQSASNYSATQSQTGRGGRRVGIMRKKSGGLAEKKNTMSSKVTSSSSSSSQGGADMSGVESEKSSTRSSPRKQVSSTVPSGKKSVDPRKLVEALTPIRETTFEEYEESAKDVVDPTIRSEAAVNVKMAALSSKDLRKTVVESHPACKGPDCFKSVFNVYGQSPLVAHFLRMKGLMIDAGQVFLVQRTEQENLPPLNAPTYRDLMKASFKKVRHVEKEYQELYDKTMKEDVQFAKQQRALLKEHMKKEASLLNRPREVKRLSDLLLLEMQKDPDSVSAGADAAIEAALMAAD